MKWIKDQQLTLKEITDLGWKQMLSRNQRQTFGLDIGSSSIKIVQLHKNVDGYTAIAAGIADIEEDDDSEANILKAIYQCLQSAGVQTKLAVSGVCGPETIVRHFEFPLLPPEEIEGAVMLEAKQVCPFNTDAGVVDYQLIPCNEKNTAGILVAVTNDLLKEKTRLIESAVLNNTLTDVDGLALLNCFRECQKYEAGRTIAILNVGSSCATLAIVGDDNLPFVRDITYAGRAVIENLALQANVLEETVEKILMGHEKRCDTQLDLYNGLESACHKLISDITETLRYYTARNRSEAIENIFVCGGFALVEGFIDLLNNQLSTAAVLWNPFDKIRYDADMPYADILRKKGPVMAVAAGLAMRTI